MRYEEPKRRGVTGGMHGYFWSERRSCLLTLSDGYIKGIRGELQGKGRLIGWVQWVLFEIVRG
jgi:hypothetical protein